MQSQRLTFLALLLFAITLPMSAQDKEAEAPAEEDTILGLWYVQVGGPEGQQMVFGSGFTMQITFGEDSVARMRTEIEGEEADSEEMGYAHDQEEATLSFHDIDEDGAFDETPDTVMQYSFVDEVLVLRFDEDEQEVTLELTRKPEGAERHQKLRKEQGDTAGEAVRAARETARAMQSSTQMRGLHQGAVTYANSNRERYPATLGEMLPGDYFTPEYVLAPWSEAEVPEDIDDWEDAKKIEWVNNNTDYVYLLAGRVVEFDTKLIAIFELPRSADQETVRVLFEDNHTEVLEYAKADEQIKKQTGHTIEVWMKTATPGAGRVVLPEKAEAAEEAGEAAGEATE